MDSEPTNGKLFCVNQFKSMHQYIINRQHIQIYTTAALCQRGQFCSVLQDVQDKDQQRLRIKGNLLNQVYLENGH